MTGAGVIFRERCLQKPLHCLVLQIAGEEEFTCFKISMAQEFNPAIFQAALLEVAEATKASTAAVQAIAAQQQQSSTSSQQQVAGGSPTGSSGSNVEKRNAACFAVLTFNDFL